MISCFCNSLTESGVKASLNKLSDADLQGKACEVFERATGRKFNCGMCKPDFRKAVAGEIVGRQISQDLASAPAPQPLAA